MGYTKATMPCLFIPETYQVYPVSYYDLSRLGETGDAIAKQTRVAAARADEYVRGSYPDKAIKLRPFGKIGKAT